MGTDSSAKRARIRKSRSRGLRTRNGCITCRRRHVKCDELKPACSLCVKHDRPCDYTTPERRSFEASDVTTNESLSSSVENIPQRRHISQERTQNDTSREHSGEGLAWTTTAATPLPPLAAPLDPLAGIDFTAPQSPITLCTDTLSPSDASYILQSVAAGSFSSPGRAVNAAAVWWFDLLANDAARDNQQSSTIPIGYLDENVSFGRAEAGEPSELTSLQRATQVLDGPRDVGNGPIDISPQISVIGEDSHIWQSRSPIELLPREHFLFEHFVQHVSQWVDLFDPTSQFSTLVAHLAIRNAGLLNAILSLACRHLSLNPRLDTEDVPNQEAAIQYYYQTLHYVQRAMQQSSYMTSLELLATTLIISAYEMLDNSSNDWERHLKGVFLIQRSQVIHGESGGLQAAVWWAWLCQDVWAAFREKRKTLTFWTPQKPLSALSPHELASRAIYIMAKVVDYCAKDGLPTEESIKHRSDKAKRLQTMLDDWRNNLTLEFSPLPSARRETATYFNPVWIRPPPFAVAMQFYCAARILLLAHEPTTGGFNQYIKRHSTIRRCGDTICGIAMTLKDDASSFMSSQAIFIAGMFTEDTRAREAVLDLLDLCRQRAGWPVHPLGDELKQIWDPHEPTKTYGS